MTYEDIPAALTEIHAALVDKLGAQPTIAPSLSIYQSGSHTIGLYPPKEYKQLFSAKGQTPEEAIRNARDFIAAMMEPETMAKQDWQKSLGKVIDEGHALNLPDEVMQPLRGASQAMTENLLAAPVRPAFATSA